MKKVPSIILGGIFLFCGIAHADTPQVSALSASPTTLSNDHTLALTWSIPNSNGQSILFRCPTGVTIRDTAGTSFACNTRSIVGDATMINDAFTVTNVSGSQQTVTATIYPRASDGSDYNAGAMSTSFTVTTAPQPLLDLSVSTTSMMSSSTVTVSWTGVDVPGANVILDCNNALSLTVPGAITPMPCGSVIFASPQSTSGSVGITAVNSTVLPSTFTVHVIPAIDTSTYDATHALSASVTVAGKTIPANPTVASFSGSPSAVYTNEAETLTWNTINATGANFMFSCVPGVTLAASSTVSTSTIPCGSTAFATPLNASDTMLIFPTNMTSYALPITATLLPQDSTGAFLGYAGKSWQFTVEPAGVTRITATSTGVEAVSGKSFTPSVPVATSGLSKSDLRAKFTASFSLGSHGNEVKRLQELLAENPAIYPEGITTGYYGTLTAAAVGRFQSKYGIAYPGDAGYGSFGPKTRAILNIAPEP